MTDASSIHPQLTITAAVQPRTYDIRSVFSTPSTSKIFAFHLVLPTSSTRTRSTKHSTVSDEHLFHAIHNEKANTMIISFPTLRKTEVVSFQCDLFATLYHFHNKEHLFSTISRTISRSSHSNRAKREAPRTSFTPYEEA
jgi:hypothetical protein